MNPWKETVKKLGELPRKQRRVILILLNTPVYISFVFNFLLGIRFPSTIAALILMLSILCAGIDIYVFTLGGWWWANEEDEEE